MMRVTSWLGLFGSIGLGMIVAFVLDLIAVLLARLANTDEYEIWKGAVRMTAVVSLILAFLLGAVEVGV